MSLTKLYLSFLLDFVRWREGKLYYQNVTYIEVNVFE